MVRKSSFLSQDDTVLFRLNEAPYTTHFQTRRAFHYNKGGLNAINYLQRGDLPDGFAWKKWKQRSFFFVCGVEKRS